MIQGAPRCAHKRPNYNSEAWREQQVVFPVVSGGARECGAIVVTAVVGHYRTRYVFIDSGSTSYIMYEQCFNQLDDEDKARLTPVSGEISGFIGKSIQPLGQIFFPVTFSDGRHTRTEVLELLVVPFTSTYDVLIGREGQA